MVRVICIKAAILCWLVPFLICLSAVAAETPPRMMWEGSSSQQKEPFIKIVDSSAEWSQLWMRAFNQTAPPVDFDRYASVCIFLGHGADWLYSINIGDPVLRDGAWIIEYQLVELILELAGPFKASGQYAIKVIEKKTPAGMILKEAKPSWISR